MIRTLSGKSDFFGLDLGTTFARAVELKGSGPIKDLYKYGSAAFEGTIAISEAKADQSKVMAVISQMLKDSGISTKNVAVNLASNRVFTTVIDLDKLPENELAKTIKFQADSYIPTPLAESKIDWAVIGDSPKDPKKIEVLLSSIANSYIESRLEMLESIGLNIIAFEPDAMAMARALVAPDSNSAQLIIDIGNAATDIVITVGSVPHLSRVIQSGQQALITAASQSLGIDQVQARQFVFKFGLGKDKLEGQIYNSILSIVEGLAVEIDKTIKFFQGRYPTLKIERLIVTGGASILPEFPIYLANKFGINVEIGSAWRNINIPPSQQNDVDSVSNNFAVAAGLAERN